MAVKCLILVLVFKLAISQSGKNVSVTRAKTESIKNLEKIITGKLRVIRNDELLVPIVQAEIDSWTFSDYQVRDEELIEKIASKISAKINPAIKIIKDICSFLTNKEHKRQVFYSLLNPCPHNDKIDFRINHFYNDLIYHNNNFSGEYSSVDILNDQNLIFHNFLLENIANAGNGWQSYRQYFLSTSDQAKIENCNNVPEISHFTRLFTSSLPNKRVLLLIDQTSEQMELTRAIAKTMISALSDSDSIAVILISNKASSFTYSSMCSKDSATSMIAATSSVKLKIYDFLDNTNRTTGIANHTLAFQKSFEVIENVYKESTNGGNLLPITFLYISEGITALFSDARNVLAEVTIGQNRLPHPVVINTIAVIANTRQLPYQTQFLQDITMQNYNKYSIDTSPWWIRKGERSLLGQMIVINRTMDNLSRMPISVVTELFKNKNFINNQVTIHSPHFDAEFSSDFIVSITKSCEQRGVFGIDIFLNYLIEDVMYSNTNNSYKFLVDMKGLTLAHSKSYPRPVTLSQSFTPVQITLLEKNKGFTEAHWQQMKNITIGNFKIGDFSFTWNRINEILIVCIVTNLSEKRPNLLNKIKTQQSDPSKHLSELVYHRLDLNNNLKINTCQYYKQLSTFDATTLHLSSKTFSSPYAHMSRSYDDGKDENRKQMIQNFMAYLRDTRNLFANPGLVDGVKQEVSGIYQIMEIFKKKHMESELKKYVIRRYVSSVNGVLQVFPGCMLNMNFEASRRSWFTKALEARGKIAITEPYLDAAGAGYIVSISYAVYEKRYSPNNRIAYQPIAVVSIDFTRGFFFKMLLDSLPICSYDDIKCFLMDDKGYLIAHKNILEATGEHFRQPEHITHKESHVANDILMQRKFVEKISCNNHINGTSLRFYQFNTSIGNEVISNYANVEKTKYQLASLKGTNIFVGIINSSSETSGAFCPCSTIDYRCLNCFRMEQNECECPCECRLDYDSETCLSQDEGGDEDDESVLPKAENVSRMCASQIENIHSYQPMIIKDNVDVCNSFSIHCDMFSEKEDCLGVINCIWCHTNDDDTTLSLPFCSSESSCYNGIFGSLGDGYNIVIDPVMNYNLLPPTYSIILPVVGVILLLFLVIGFAMYCYRINYDNNGFAEHLYIDNGSMDNNCIGMMQMSRFDYDEPPIDEQMGSNLNQSLLNTNENVIVSNIQSPYRIATNAHYRHPNSNGYTDSSDHGYSTMGTHHEESEPHVSTSNRQNKRFSLSDSASVNTSISSPQHTQPYDISLPSPRQTTAFINNSSHHNYPPADQTILSPKRLSPHQVIAEVTVHRLMD